MQKKTCELIFEGVDSEDVLGCYSLVACVTSKDGDYLEDGTWTLDTVARVFARVTADVKADSRSELSYQIAYTDETGRPRLVEFWRFVPGPYENILRSVVLPSGMALLCLSVSKPGGVKPILDLTT